MDLALSYTCPIMASQEPTRKRTGPPTGVPPAAQDIPDQLYFRIGEVARLCNLEPYVLRFWESEFTQLKPNKGGTGQRLYRRRDVEMAMRIKQLLYNEGYTIPGARQAIKAELRAGKDAQLGLGGVGDTVDARHLQSLQKELRDLHALLSRPAAPRQALQPIRASRSALKPAGQAPPAPHPFPKRPTLQLSDPLFEDLPD